MSPDAFRPAEDREIMGEKIIHTVVTPGQKPGRAQIREIGEAAERPVAPDDECPELTGEQYEEMAAIRRKRRAGNTEESHQPAE